jgi:TolA-binding protein
MIRLYLLLSTLSLLAASEPSAFSAGDLESKTPYGLTKTEKYIFQNKEEISDLKSRLIRMESALDELRSALEAFRSLTSGGNEKLYSVGQRLSRLETDVKLQSGYQKKIDGDISAIDQKMAQNKIELTASDTNLKTAIKELSGLIDTINNTYVHKNEMRAALEKLVKEIESGKPASSPTSTFEKKNPADIFEESKQDFKKKAFKSSLEGFEYLAQHTDYKKAEVLYFLGELYYQTGYFSKAITAFKQSAKLDDKAAYIPALLFHTAICYDKLKNKAEAKKFYESLITLYPGSYLVESAKARLSKL